MAQVLETSLALPLVRLLSKSNYCPRACLGGALLSSRDSQIVAFSALEKNKSIIFQFFIYFFGYILSFMKNLDTNKSQEDYEINVRMIAFSVATLVLVVIAIFFIKTYAEQKQEIINTMHTEGGVMEAFYSENLNQTWYVLNLLSEQINKNPHEVKYVKNILKDYIGSADVKDIFGWAEFVWFDHKFHRRVSGSGSVDRKYDPMINEESAFAHRFPEKMLYLFNDKKESIHAVVGVWNQETKDYIGSVAVDFDLTTLMRHLDDRKRSESTAFALIGDGLRVIAQSRPNMEDVGLHEGRVVERHLVDLIKKIGFTEDTHKAFTFLDMISGVNYYVQKIPEQPFVLLVNMDHDEIKKDIFSKVTIKFAETSFLAISFLVLIILIYRRETWLRSGAEAALKVANRATKAKSDFLAFTAHEIRSPLGFIMTGSEVMKQQLLGPVDSRYNEYIDGIHQNANMILEFITDILDEAHILDGNFKIVAAEANIKTIINKAVAINLANNKSRIKVKVEARLPLLICDARRILQVLNNLISNALKYSKTNTIVRVVARVQDHDLYLEVIDQGSGMTEDEIAIALTQYGTLRKKNFDFIASYGLGLPIVKKLLSAHDAKLIIDSTVNVGTKISIIFPREKLAWGVK